jgi:hypothetical protein
MIGKIHLNEQQHAMLLNPSNDEHDAATKYVNEALNRGYLTVCLPINGDHNNKLQTSKIAISESINYEENMNRGNLLTLDTRTFYNLALAGDFATF